MRRVSGQSQVDSHLDDRQYLLVSWDFLLQLLDLHAVVRGHGRWWAVGGGRAAMLKWALNE